MEKVFRWRNSEINYVRFGQGKETLICLHGYGQNGSVFQVFEPSLGERFSIVSIDLPYQGKTKWREEEKLGKALLVELIQAFMTEIEVRGRVSLMAYSIGGNYALGLVAAFPERIKHVWLIAADGLKPKPAFNFITKTSVGQQLFRMFILYPAWVFYTLRLAGVLGLASKRVIRFYYSTMDSRLKRQALFDRWTSTARISVHPKLAIEAINRNHIPVCLIFGKKDSVIPVRNAERFHEAVPGSKLYIINAGHKLIEPETNEVLAGFLAEDDND